MDVPITKAIALPPSVLTSHIFAFVDSTTLKQCTCVSREWQRAADEDVVWKRQCARAWKKKKNVPKLEVKDNEEEPERLYPYAIYPPSIKLSLKELKQILPARDVSTTKFIEKAEFERALTLSQPKYISGWRALYTSKWKCSYMYSVVRSKSKKITRHELISSTWELIFKFNGARSEAKFLGDGSYWSTSVHVAAHQNLRWVTLPNPDGTTFEFSGVMVGEYRKCV